MWRVIPYIGACLFLTAGAEAAFAQHRLFVRIFSEVVELDPRLPSLGTVIRRFPVPADHDIETNRDVTALAGGRFLAWVGNSDVVLLDTQSSAIHRFTFPGFNAARVIGTDGNARLVVLGGFFGGNQVVLVADARSGRTQFTDLGSASTLGPITYAAAADILFIARHRTVGPSIDTKPHDIDVIQLATGDLLHTIDISPVSAGLSLWGQSNALLSNSAGTRLFVSDPNNGGMFAFDVGSGRQSGSNTSAAFAGLSFLDEHRNRLLTNHSEFVEAFSPDSMELLGTVNIPRLPLPSRYLTGQSGRWPTDLDVSGLSATMFVLHGAVAFN